MIDDIVLMQIGDGDHVLSFAKPITLNPLF